MSGGVPWNMRTRKMYDDVQATRKQIRELKEKLKAQLEKYEKERNKEFYSSLRAPIKKKKKVKRKR